ncbi:hypothetical protein [Acidisoma sp. 7E03]
MIREIDEQPVWTGVIKPGAISGSCRVGKVIRRSVWGGTTIMFTVELLTGRLVRLSPDLVNPMPSSATGELDIPPVPADAVIVVGSFAAVMKRRAMALGVSVADLIEAGLDGPDPMTAKPQFPSEATFTRRALFRRGHSERA